MLLKNTNVGDLTSLADLAQELSINKSKLSYYAKVGLISPITTIGKTGLFDRIETIKRLKKIESFQKGQGATLEEILKMAKLK